MRMPSRSCRPTTRAASRTGVRETPTWRSRNSSAGPRSWKPRATAACAPGRVATAALTLARLAQSEGDREGALRIASGAAAALAGVDNTPRADAPTIIGSVHEALGNTAEADRAYNEAIAALTKTGVGPAYAQVTTEYAEILSKRGESARARS